MQAGLERRDGANLHRFVQVCAVSALSDCRFAPSRHSGLGNSDGELGALGVGDAVARVSPATSASWALAAATRSAGPAMVSAIRSETSRPASRRACWTARTRSRASPRPRARRERRVEDDEAAARAARRSRTARRVTGDGLEGVLPLDQRQATGRHVPSSATDQSPDFEPLIASLHVLAQPRAGGARVDGELLGDAVRRGVGRCRRRAAARP
jgi:hypothetical protein